MLWLGCFSIQTLPKKYFEIKKISYNILTRKSKKMRKSNYEITRKEMKKIKINNIKKRIVVRVVGVPRSELASFGGSRGRGSPKRRMSFWGPRGRGRRLDVPIEKTLSVGTGVLDGPFKRDK